MMSMCRVFSCVVGRGCLLWPVRSLGKTLLAFALLHSVFQGQICLLPQVFLDFLLLHSSPLYWKGHLFRVLVLKGLVGLHRTVQLPLLLLPPIPPSIRVFSNESTLCMRLPKYQSFSFSISPSKEHPGLISFRMDGWISLQSKGLSSHSVSQ